ncbi:FhuF-like iron-sulfur protein [Herbihabitans rhizosphaerae]|uniref:FhuF-like iron-sulfur protein n=1 Tax=Herbihabitans rhizosphaerae TaxID=1872711 RepID=A0A4Q7KK74_9PSEU|nr:(2Fe-2S)-binding protein [Herbihabitans rhizosphaerae]RZS34655.1 FhuF-like iron-sulfur protein [Herbihabitans rhizosphaerae]
MTNQHLRPVPAVAITDASWLDAQLDAARRRYRFAQRDALGVLWWYSASSVLLGPVISSLGQGDSAADPGLAATTLYLHPDGRVLDARSDSVCPDDHAKLGPAIADSLRDSIDAVVAASGAHTRALWAIASDSLGNRLLWADRRDLAEPLALAIGPELPRPRYVEVGGTHVVRRNSCCLVYRSPGTAKCASCPRQHPDERAARLRAALG